MAREVVSTSHRPLFLVFLFVVSQFFFAQSSMFKVQDVRVTGSTKFPESAVLAAMDLGPESTFWDLSAERLESNILDLHGVESAEVTVAFPNRVDVRVSDRQPLFTVSSLATTRQPFSVDKTGLILGRGEAPPGSLRLVIERDVRAGGRLSGNELEVALYLKDHLRPFLLQRLGQVRFDERGEVTLMVSYQSAKIPVRLGRAERLSYKLFLLEELLASLKAESAKVVSIDLRFSTPIVRQPVVKSATPEASPPSQL